MKRTLTLSCLAAVGLVPASAQAAVPTSTTTAKIVVATNARSAPSDGARTIMRLRATAPLYGGAHVLRVEEQRTVDGIRWVRVYLPRRPNGSLGWVHEDSVLVGRTSYYMQLSRAKRTLTVYRSGKRVKRFKVVVGKASTPTPAGQFAVHEIVPQPRGTVLGPYVLALTAYSNVLKQFGGGPGQTGIHGRSGSLLADPLGSARSHGCIRLDNAAVSWLAKRVPAGTALRIT